MVKPTSTEKSWDEFVNSGLMVFVNVFLQIFGWTIRVIEDEDGDVKKVYPVRISTRNVNEKEIQNAHIKLNSFINKNIISLNSDISDLEEEVVDRPRRRAKARVSLEDIFKR